MTAETGWAIDTLNWGLPGVPLDPEPPDAETFCATPLLELLEAAAERNPDAVALTSWTARLTYRALLDRVRNVAASVVACVPVGGTIACLLPRSPDGVAAVLGCLVSGRVCLIADPDYPAERLTTLLADAAPDALLTAVPMPFDNVPIVLNLDQISGRTENNRRRPAGIWDPDAPSAVHFTSGSSGRPKGIVLSARSILYRALHTSTGMNTSPDDRIFTLTSHVTSANLAMILGGLLRGARVLVANIVTEGINTVLRLFEREAVTLMTGTAPVLRTLLGMPRARAAFGAVRLMRAGGVSIAGTDLAAWRPVLPPTCAIQHAYSSTEALVVAVWIVPPEADAKPGGVPSGVLQSVHDCAILDPDGSPVPFGEPGELVLRGRYLALGEWVGGRLVPGPMMPAPGRPGARIFRTGDLVRIAPDGIMRVLGRADRQIKVNGVRIEPAEIEAVIRADPRVTDAVAVLSSGTSAPELLGFALSDDPDTAELVSALRRRLAQALPTAARPARLIVLTAFPMLSSGKIDLAALSRWAAD